MTDLSKLSRLCGDDLRKAEKTIQLAQRDLLQFLLTTTETNIALGYSPVIAQPMTRPGFEALAAIEKAQTHMSGEAHRAAVTIGKRLGLSVVDWGGGDDKPDSVFKLPVGQLAAPEPAAETAG